MAKAHHTGDFCSHKYFLIASILSYLMKLVSTLAVGDSTFQSMINTLLICNF